MPDILFDMVLSERIDKVKYNTFSDPEDKSPMGGGTTDRGRLVSWQKTAVFLPRKPGEALD